MNKIYVPIGCGCASATLLKNRGLRYQSLPFDWVLSHLSFVNIIIKSLYEDSIDETVELFLNQENTTIFSTFIKHNGNTDISLKYRDNFGNVHDNKFEAYQTLTLDSNLGVEYPRHPYNLKYKITFPHDLRGDNKEKYIRRLNRLKSILLDQTNFITFVYISPSSKDTHYSIDGEILTNDAPDKLNELCYFLKLKRSDFDIIFIDSLKTNSILDSKIKKIEVESFKNWFPMITKSKIEL